MQMYCLYPSTRGVHPHMWGMANIYHIPCGHSIRASLKINIRHWAYMRRTYWGRMPRRVSRIPSRVYIICAWRVYTMHTLRDHTRAMQIKYKNSTCADIQISANTEANTQGMQVSYMCPMPVYTFEALHII